MEMSKWQSQFPEEKKSTYEELLTFFPEKVRDLFLKFNDDMNNVYQVYNRWQRYEKRNIEAVATYMSPLR